MGRTLRDALLPMVVMEYSQSDTRQLCPCAPPHGVPTTYASVSSASAVVAALSLS